MKAPLYQLINRLKRLPPQHRIAHLRAILSLEKPFSVRRNELGSLLAKEVLTQLKKENRAA